MDFLQIAERLMSQPAIAYHEQAVARVVEEIAHEMGLKAEKDRWGNLVVGYNTAPEQRPLALMAHMDHPGFRVDTRMDDRRFRSTFRGGVGAPYFKAGVPVLLMPGRVPARLESAEKDICVLEAFASVEMEPLFAVWDLAEFRVAGDWLQARACDDLAGVAAILNVLWNLVQTGARANVLGLFTRAEEVGFHGALMAASSSTVPRYALVISLETSRELPPVKQGEGVIIRVGDKQSVFDSRLTRFLAEVGSDETKRHPAFRYQRALMSGGTCEATPFSEAGYQTGAVCIALGNYHNCGPGERIAEEFVHLQDARSMVQLLTRAAERVVEFGTLSERLNGRLESLAREAEMEFTIEDRERK